MKTSAARFRPPSLCRHLLLTTALIGTAPLVLTPAPALSQMYLDNDNQTNTLVDPATGEWAAGDPIWSDAAGQNHAALPVGGTGILEAADATPITLTVIGTVRPGELRVTAGDFTLTGGQIGTSVDSWILNVGTDLTLKVGATLSGTLQVAGNGTVHFTGAQTGQLDISSDTKFRSDGSTAGALTIDGTAQLDGQHNGAVTVASGGTLTGTGTINGALDNRSTATISGQVGSIANSGTLTTAGNLTATTLVNSGTVSVTGGNMLTATTIDNRSTLDVAGTVVGALTNSSGGILTLDGGTVTGAVDAQAGSRIRIASNSRIDGDLTNAGTLDMTGAADARLDLTGHTLTHSGSIAGTGAGRLTLAADQLVFEGSAVVDTATTGLEGAITNRARLNVSGDMVLTGDLVTGAGGTTVVTSALDAAGFDVTNNGTFEARSGASVSDIGTLTNTNGLTILAGGSVAADSTGNSGTLTLGGDLTSDLTNSVTVILTGGTLTGDLSNNGALTGTGSITGALDNRNTATISGQVGSIVNSGTLTSTGDLTTTTLTNSGTVNVAGGDVLTATAISNSNALNVAGTLAGDLTNSGSVTLDAAGMLIGQVENDGGSMTLQGGGIRGDLRNQTSGTVRITADSEVTGDVTNLGAFDMAGIAADAALTVTGGSFTNAGTLTESGGRDLTIKADSITLQAGSVITDIDLLGDILNQGRLTHTQDTTLGGDLINAAGGVFNVLAAVNAGGHDITNNGVLEVGSATGTGSLTGIGALENGAALTIHGGSSVEAGSAINLAGGELVIGGTLIAPELDNRSGGTTSISGHLTGDLTNAGSLTGTGRVTGDVTSSGTMDWSGAIGGDLTNHGTADLAGTIGGGILNEGTLSVNGSLKALAGVLNEAGATLTNLGRIEGDLDSHGRYQQAGTLDGSLISRGITTLAGQVTGDVGLVAGRLDAADGLNIGGTLSLGQDFTVAAGRRITAGATEVADDAALTLAGVLDSGVTNEGRIVAKGGAGRIGGELVNNGTVALAGDGRIGALTVGGVAGTGEYRLDVDLAQMASDRIVVDGGAAQGHMKLFLNGLDQQNAMADGRTTLVKVDGGFTASNSYTYDYSGNFGTSERIVYSLEQAATNGDLELVSQTNPAIGAIFGNVALTQSLIGSVVNRPTSPFVTGLAAQDDEKPCGISGWGRATGGHATATGATDNSVSRVESRIRAQYYGLQFGGDLACFDGRHGGWNTALGVLGGVNTGRTTQPVYAIDGRDSSQITDQVSSLNKSEFTQVYGGAYITGTRGNWMVDLQLRHENTRFKMSNVAVGGASLGLQDASFSNKANTLSGALSYGFALGENQSWSLIPTAGFAWSRMSTDTISFADGYQLSFEDSDRKIGFIGGTLAKTFVYPEDKAALGTYVTATYYKDFADPTVSVFSHRTDTSFTPQRLVSDNLDAYGEVSIGATWVKVLGSGSRARQFSASSRIDARFGNGLESVGVTGQVRWQF